MQVRRSASKYNLHPYWSMTAQRVHRLETSYYGMTWKRVSAMAQQLKSSGRNDFLIEKGKCTM